MLFRTVRERDFKNIIINGDLFDNYELSRFVKHPLTLDDAGLDTEIHYVKKNYLAPLRDLQPNANIVLIPGNHEYRWTRNLWNEIADVRTRLRRLGIEDTDKLYHNFGDIVGLKEFDISYHIEPTERMSVYKLRNKVSVSHGDVNGGSCLKWSSANAKKYALENGGYWIIGHNHRMGWFTHTYSSGETCFGWENGCLCKNMEYDATPDWQRGFCILKWNGSKFMIEPMIWI